MSRTSFHDSMVVEAIAHAEQAEQLLEEVARLGARNDMSTVQIPEVTRKAEIHAQLAETYSRLATIEERR